VRRVEQRELLEVTALVLGSLDRLEPRARRRTLNASQSKMQRDTVAHSSEPRTIMHRPPQDTIATIDDFRHSGWEVVVEPVSDKGYSWIHEPLAAAGKKAVEAGCYPQGKVLWLLADACSMMLQPGSPNAPFRPFAVMGGKRSVIPDDFSELDMTLLGEIAQEIGHVWLRARLADLVWLCKKPRNYQDALLAIDAYRTIPLTLDSCLHGAREAWKRALSLTSMLRAGAGERAKEMETSILIAFDAADEGSFLPLWLSELLFSYNFGNDRSAHLAGRLSELATTLDQQQGSLQRAREFYDAASKWFKRAGNEAAAATMIAAVAEGWAKDAVARTSSDTPSYLAATSFYEKALQNYRRIPRSERAAHRADERMAEIHKQMSDAGVKSLGEMRRIQSPSIDITAIMEEARKAVRGKPTDEALAAFASFYPGPKLAKLREESVQMLRSYPLQTLVDSTHVSPDGRVVAKTSAAAKIQAEMIRHYLIESGLVVQGCIWPALEVLLQEHRLREDALILIARQSSIVPIGRERLFGKALFAGFDRNFEVAIHLLVPQIENIVRTHLKASGGKTTSIDLDGIENEIGLSALMELPEAEKVFGESLAFELKALFCDSLGPNLRNEVAHGLLDDGAFDSLYCIYAWWFAFKLAYTPFWNALRAQAT
jgi:hypothetical protein